MNKVIESGRMTKDPDIRYSQGEKSTAIARFTLAVDRRFKRDGDEQTADFIGCVAFGKTAEFIEKYGRKGVKFDIVGRIQTGRYTNKDGQTVFTTDVVVEEIEFAESKRTGDVNTSTTAAPAANTAATTAAKAPAAASASTPYTDGFMYIPDGIDEELPFN